MIQGPLSCLSLHDPGALTPAVVFFCASQIPSWVITLHLFRLLGEHRGSLLVLSLLKESWVAASAADVRAPEPARCSQELTLVGLICCLVAYQNQTTVLLKVSGS